MRCPVLVAVLCVVVDAGAVAQAPPLAPGQRVRVTAAAAQLHKQVATLQALEGDVLVLVVDTIMRVPVTAVERLDVHAAGTFQAIRGDTVVLGGETTRVVPLGSVERLEVFTGRHGHPWRGAKYGLLVGAVSGAAVGLVACEDYQVGVNGNCFDSNDGGQIAFLFPFGIGVLAGPILGAVIGALIKTDKWDEVPLDGLRVTIVLRGGDAGAGVSLRF